MNRLDLDVLPSIHPSRLTPNCTLDFPNFLGFQDRIGHAIVCSREVPTPTPIVRQSRLKVTYW